MVGGANSDESALSADQATLSEYVKGTRLQGRATIDPSLAGTDTIGVTDGLTGRVRISPDAFGSEGLLNQVVYHEGVHVEQVAAMNFAAYKGSGARGVNEAEALRAQLRYSLPFSAQDVASEAARANAMYLLSDTLEALQGTSYYQQVTSYPYNYRLDPSDRCVACSLR
jgi:hypothetical protein